MLEKIQFNKISNISLTKIAFTLQFLFLCIIIYKIFVIKNSIDNFLPLNTISLERWLILPGVIGVILVYVAKKDENTFLKKVNFFLKSFSISLIILYLISSIIYTKILVYSILFALLILIIYVIFIFKNKDKFLEYLNEVITENEDIKEIKSKPGDMPLGEILIRNVDEDGKPFADQDDFIPSGKKGVIPLSDRFVHVLVLGPTGSGKTSQTLLPAALADFTSDSYDFGEIKVVQTGQIVLEPKGDFAKAFWTFGKIKEEEKRKNYMQFLLDIPNYLASRIDEFVKDRERFFLLKNGEPLSKEEQQKLSKYEKMVASGNVADLETAEQIDIYATIEKLTKKRDGGELTEEEEKELQLIEKNLKKLLTIKREVNKYLEFNFQFLNDLSTYALLRYATLLNDMIANPKDLTKDYWQLIVDQDPQQKRDVVLLFDPQNKQSPYFNPMFGDESAVVGNITSTLTSFMEDSSQFFLNMAKTTIQNAVRVAKRVYGNDATLTHVNDLLMNNNSKGEDIVRMLDTLDTTLIQANENKDLKTYFLNDYYSGLKGLKNATKTYEHTSGIRAVLNNLLDNENVRRVLCPPPGIGTDLNFDEILRTGDKLAISTATGASDMVNRMLGSFIILQIQTAIFNRTGNENTRTPMILTIDEAHEYLNDSFDSVFSKGRSYVVSAVIATQTLGLFNGGMQSRLVSNITTNSRNIISYPGLSPDNIDKFLVAKFGERTETIIDRSISQELKDEPTKLDNIKSSLGLSDSEGGGSPRESVKEITKTVSRFTKDQLLYGVNVRTKKINDNDGFGTIIYQIMVNKSPQVPTAAKIEYIPYDIKKKSDKIIASYDSLLSEINQSVSKEDVLENNEDPLKDEQVFDNNAFNKNLTKVGSKNTDPKEFARDLHSEKTQDLEENLNEFISTDDFVEEVDVKSLEISQDDIEDLDFEEFK